MKHSDSFVDLVGETTDEDGWFDASPEILANESSIESRIRRFIGENPSLFRREGPSAVDDVDQLFFVITELDGELRR